MTLPWHLYPAEDSTLQIKPVEELENLRFDRVDLAGVTLEQGEERAIDPISSNCMQIKMTVIFERGGTFGFKLLCSPDGEEETVITYNGREGKFIVGFERASLNRGLRYPDGSWQQIFPYGSGSNKLIFDIFVDRSVIEIFVNNDICIVQRVYPTLKESTRVNFFSQCRTAKFEKITKWEMDAANSW